jgi:hypothetical protein
MKKCKLTAIFLIVFFICVKGQNDTLYRNLHLNEIQIIGSHNSYKKVIEPDLLKLIFNKDSVLAYSLQYEHLSLDSQLTLGLRSLELDVYHDPLGGKYKNPVGFKYLRKIGVKPESFDTNNELNKPGLKVFHIQGIDFRSTNLLFIDCLRSIKKWSDKNKDHVPIIITINAKDSKIDLDSAVVPFDFSRSALDSIDLEIRSVFSKDELITPDFIQGKYPSLEEAVMKKGWPKIHSVSGRFLFVLDEKGKKLNNYLNPDGSLRNKVMFVNLKEGNPCAAIRIINDPIKNEAYIQKLVKEGYIVRTRADDNTWEARRNFYGKFKKAVESGAQIISTDYYLPSRLFNSTYHVVFDNLNYIKINKFLITN